MTADKIKGLRTKMGWSAIKMGKFFDRTAATIYNWENGDSTPGANVSGLMTALDQEFCRREECHPSVEVDRWVEQLGKDGLNGFLSDLSVRPGFKAEAYKQIAREAETEGGLLLCTASDEPLAYVIPLTETGLLQYTKKLMAAALENGHATDLLRSFAEQLRSEDGTVVSVDAEDDD